MQAAVQGRSAPFDAVAESYDELFTASKIGMAQRQAVWHELARAFPPRSRVLDLGCGTGVDALFLAHRGVSVLACDASPRMIAVAGQKLAGESGIRTVELRRLAVEEIQTLEGEGPFDGAFSNFGALNCVSDLSSVAQSLSKLLRPRATLMLCLLGPSCAWEMAWYLAHGRPARAFRRLNKDGVTARIGDENEFHVWYPSAREVKRAFAPAFHLQSWKGVGVAVPPSYLNAWAERFPGLLRWCAQVDEKVARCPLIRGLADHILLHLVREP